MRSCAWTRWVTRALNRKNCSDACVIGKKSRLGLIRKVASKPEVGRIYKCLESSSTNDASLANVSVKSPSARTSEKIKCYMNFVVSHGTTSALYMASREGRGTNGSNEYSLGVLRL